MSTPACEVEVGVLNVPPTVITVMCAAWLTSQPLHPCFGQRPSGPRSARVGPYMSPDSVYESRTAYVIPCIAGVLIGSTSQAGCNVGVLIGPDVWPGWGKRGKRGNISFLRTWWKNV